MEATKTDRGKLTRIDETKDATDVAWRGAPCLPSTPTCPYTAQRHHNEFRRSAETHKHSPVWVGAGGAARRWDRAVERSVATHRKSDR